MKDFLFNEESGQGMVEYGLILALVSIVAIAALVLVGKGVFHRYNTVAGQLEGTTAPEPA